MLNIIYTIIIYPIYLLLECIYATLYTSIFKENIVISLAGLSLAVNLFCLPLYAKTEVLQQTERDIQKKMAGRIASIKRCFKGDERYMLLSMYYRENHYHPVMALRSSAGLLIQAPFFIAAYSFLSRLDSLNGKSLFFITDLGSPYSLYVIQNIPINILPIIMTLINIVSSAIYSRSFPIKDKIQLYIMSFVFLILLYNSPSALVLYWTMNNIFSLVKNIMSKTKKPFAIAYLFGCLVFFIFMIYVVFIRYNNPIRAFRNKMFSVVLLFIFALLPVYIRFIKYTIKPRLAFLFTTYEKTKQKTINYVLSCICIWILVGCFIPINLVSSDPVQFASIDNITTPFLLFFSPAIQALGLFVFWPLCLYFIVSKKTKSLLASLFPCFALCALSNFFIFYKKYGIISTELVFDLPFFYNLSGPFSGQLLNLFVCILISAVVFFFIRLKKMRLVSATIAVFIVSIAFLSVVKLNDIQVAISHHNALRQRVAGNSVNQINLNTNPVFTLSKTGKNIIFVMLDRAINSYFSLCLEEKPELKESFKGFVYYPNTVSFYRNTSLGAPPLFGGYEYTSYRMNERTEVSMRDKNNESILLLPELFARNGYSVLVADMPNVDYEEIMDPEFYIKRGIKAQNTIGKYSDKYLKDELGLEEYPPTTNTKALLERNFLLFSILESSIYSIREFLYQNGNYWSITDYSRGAGIPKIVIDNYAVLNYLQEITEITDDDYKGCVNIFTNDLTHNAAYLQYPDYIAGAVITEAGENFFGNDSYKYYHVNIASYLLLSKWFNFLRDNDVWDNTRIIIVSDHGWSGITNPRFSSFQNTRALPYNPILLFKDFNINDELEVNMEFMTNADAPLLAVKGLIENPTNPFTGKKLKPEKDDGIYICTDGNINAKYYNGNNCLVDFSKFYYVHDSIFDNENWRELQYKDFKNLIR